MTGETVDPVLVVEASEEEFGGVPPSSASSAVSFADCAGVRVRVGCSSSPLPEPVLAAGVVVMGTAREAAARRTSAMLHFCTRL